MTLLCQKPRTVIFSGQNSHLIKSIPRDHSLIRFICIVSLFSSGLNVLYLIFVLFKEFPESHFNDPCFIPAGLPAVFLQLSKKPCDEKARLLAGPGFQFALANPCVMAGNSPCLYLSGYCILMETVNKANKEAKK